MLQAHLDLTTGEVVGRLKKDWTADIKAYDAGHDHMLKFADLLAERELPSYSPYPAVDCSEGAVKQFPDKFERRTFATRPDRHRRAASVGWAKRRQAPRAHALLMAHRVGTARKSAPLPTLHRAGEGRTAAPLTTA